jgi:hypothetical protein
MKKSKSKSKSKKLRFADVDEIVALWRSLNAPTFDQPIETVSWNAFRAAHQIRSEAPPKSAAAWVARDSLKTYCAQNPGPLYVANVLGHMHSTARTIEFIRCAYWEFHEKRTVRWFTADWRDDSQVLPLLNAWMAANASQWRDGYGNCRYLLPGNGICAFSRPRSVKSCVCDTWGDCVSEVDELTRVAHHTTQAMQKWRLVRFDAYKFWSSRERPDDVPAPSVEGPMGVVLNFPPQERADT